MPIARDSIDDGALELAVGPAVTGIANASPGSRTDSAGVAHTIVGGRAGQATGGTVR